MAALTWRTKTPTVHIVFHMAVMAGLLGHNIFVFLNRCGVAMGAL